MASPPAKQDELEATILDFYRQGVRALTEAGIPFLVGGAFALRYYTGIIRHTKDLDFFVRPEDYPRVLEQFAARGFRTELTDPQWLAKVFFGEDYIDVIFGSGKGLDRVDDAWFEHAVEGEALGLPVRICPAEEMIWSKAFVMERERYDGADIAHLLRARGRELDWPRLLRRFGLYWRVLFSYLILFGFIYPSERSQIPAEVMTELMHYLQEEISSPPPAHRVCQGTLLSHTQYLIDLEQWGYQDGRLYTRNH